MSAINFNLHNYKELIFALTKRNIKVRYKQTIMGFLWALFMPLVIVLAGIVVRKAMSIFSGRPLELAQIISVSVKSLPWAFFIGAVKLSVNSLVGNMGLIKKIYFPREVFPLSYVFAQLFDFAIASCALILILVFVKIGSSIYLLWVPLILLFLILLATGLGMLLSCANVFFRDIKYIVDVIFTFGIFFTPVFFEAEMFGKWGILLLLNPVGAILENLNKVVILHQPPNFFWLTYAGCFALLTALGSYIAFKKLELKFAEII